MLLTKNIFLSLTLLVSLSFNLFCETSTTIDATSSASRKYTISGGTVDDNSATINWSSRYNNGQLEIKWGTNISNLDNSKSMYPYRRGTTAELTLDNLQPDTKYYYRIEGEWLGNYFTNLINGSFKTKPANAAANSSVTNTTVSQTIIVTEN